MHVLPIILRENESAGMIFSRVEHILENLAAAGTEYLIEPYQGWTEPELFPAMGV